MFLVKDFKGFTTYEKVFFGLFMLVQVAILVYFRIVDGTTDWLNVVASVSGILCVIMSAKGRLSTFFYGLIQVASYGYISYMHKYYGEVGLQVVFGIFQFVGLYFWIRNMHSDHLTDDPNVQEVDSRGLDVKGWGITAIITAAIYSLVVYLLVSRTDANQPFVDGIATSLSLVGQTLMTLRYKEQWLFWILINIVSIFLWARGMFQNGVIDAAGVTMVVMWIGFLINSVYGYYYWKKLQHANVENR
ncbi:nicotinamide riboside transporter PnuC [Macrococcoides canis]|uniref:Nicotinamide riboside transporter PnuC n=1 Tax=Macrococcoides canis TaxID=1855823 RepID=A0A4R6C827_9STAP|nr:nicotinamide riboside transporter PnuC [Macrococcus canis]MEE1106963.1 nicotinamide riboside transporter PnuC [Macrococcus canis]TDM18644.1 nicotinamide riboside transporter PnuC [Macrococcus canis]TDM21311.1 nicotinamide riboside transporter PnuC [Macrococcus canis]TDM23862.1 nicotinamide riboside transporter PnuC [Macrococcus canis]TDM35115.1 nicotinamide riboside transporter PnuC [Macrococcus canis]